MGVSFSKSYVNKSSVFRGKLCPQTANWVSKHAYCSLLCHNDAGWNPSNISTQFWSNYKVLWLSWINSQGHQNLSISFLLPNNVSMQVWWRKPNWFRRQSSEKAKFTVFKDGDLANEVTLKVRSRVPKSYQLIILPKLYNTLSLGLLHCSIQEISYKICILVKIWYF